MEEAATDGRLFACDEFLGGGLLLLPGISTKCVVCLPVKGALGRSPSPTTICLGVLTILAEAARSRLCPGD